jgi:hypothetical protein
VASALDVFAQLRTLTEQAGIIELVSPLKQIVGTVEHGHGHHAVSRAIVLWLTL